MINSKNFITAFVISLLLHLFLIASISLLPSFDFSFDASPIEVFLEEPQGGWRIADIPEPAVQEKPEKSQFLGMYSQKVKDEAVTEVSSGIPEERNTAVPEDFYPDFKHGEHTYINVLRYPDVEYFVRLMRIFKMTWNPAPAIHRDMAETSVSRGGVSVVLAVSVDKSGDLSELFVLRSSGLANYDDEAVRTVRASSPFSAPPEKFLEDDRVLRMSWTFIVYL